ncbi:hypothetical protein [Microvirga arsenatis]|uniref:Uncharacterized protein n=1 Tax=Microvirga arsenatis TaxID=2692265 RepID=A0ABW9YZH2_9HYPH|nr:hypothetical protein [Microvirga arsenatis]NBJ10856.1 hypothetical protein [Microvirga arsenatis]NBJ24246.1 hypothetical protein [Microvirga arsenatis]
MAVKDALALCGRVGLILAAFAFVAGIVAGPLLEKVWTSPTSVTERETEAAPPKASVVLASEKRG